MHMCKDLKEGQNWNLEKSIKGSFEFLHRNGESGTAVDPASRTTRENKDFWENLHSTHWSNSMEYYTQNAVVKI